MSVDSRIVTMKFDNRQFESGARTSMSTLQRLKSSMSFGSVAKTAVGALGGITGILGKFGIKNPFASATQGAADLSRSAQQANSTGLSQLEGGITHVSGAFLAMATVAITALSNVTNRAIGAGLTFAKSFTFQPVLDGLHEYETNLKAIQTVQANTDRPLPEINKALQDLNRYSDLTIYNFGEMARNVGTFTAAGVDLKTSVSSIKGIANLAALSGSSSEQAATAMYQLSQAIASGRVGLMDWNSVVNAGMGGKKLQNALAQTAIAMGELPKGAVKLEGPMKKLTINGQSFRNSIMAQPGQETWLTSDALVNTLASMDGRFSKAALSQEKLKDGTLKYNKASEVTKQIEKNRQDLAKKGVVFTDEQFKALQKMSTAAFQSATKVKTLGQVFDVAKETIGSGWSASFQSIFGNLNEAKKLFTGMSNGLTNIINANALARNNLLAKWKKIGGRDTLIDGLTNAWHAFYGVIQAVGKGFRDVFPKQTAKGLLDLTQKFEEFTHKLLPSKDTLASIRSIAAGVASIFSIVGKVIGGVVHGLGTLAGAAGAGHGSFLQFVAGIADAITHFNQFLGKTDLVNSFFDGLAGILAVPLALLKGVGGLIADIFTGFNTGTADKATGAIDKFGNALSPMQSLASKVAGAFASIGKVLGNVAGVIGNALSHVGDMVANMFTPETFSQSLAVINTSLLGGIVLLIHNFFNKGINVNVGGGIAKNLSETLGAATGALQNMQASLKADILLKIAGALALLTLSIAVLATINGKDMAKSLAALGVGFVGLQVGMVSLMGAMQKFGYFKIAVVSKGILMIAAALLVLAIAVKIMASIEFPDMVRGLLGLAGALFIIQKAMIPLMAQAEGFSSVAAGLVLVGVALNLIAIAVKVFGSMNLGEMIQGLFGVTAAIAGIGLAMRLMPKGILLQSVALVALGVALNIIAGALKIFATMSWPEMAKGLIMLAGALGIIALGLALFPATLPLTAAGLILVGIALNEIAAAVKIMASMGWEEIAKGMVVLAGALAIIAVAMDLMMFALPGAAALLVVAASLAILAPVLVTFGAMDWMSILKGLTMLAGVFVVIGLAGLLLTPLILTLLGLGVAMVLIGGGLALAGAGALLFATAFAELVATGTAGIGLLKQYFTDLITALPKFMAALGKGLVSFVQAIASNGPRLVTAMAKIVGNMLDAIARNAPKFGNAFMALLTTGLKIISRMAPKIYAAGLDLILGFLRALSSRIGGIVKVVSSLIVNFLNALGNNVGRVVDAGVRFIIKFINGLSTAMDNHSAELGRAGGRLAVAIVHGIIVGIGSGASTIADAARNAARSALHAAADFLGVGSPSKVFRDEIGKKVSHGFALGIDDNAHMAVRSAEAMGKSALSTLKSTMDGVSNALDISADMNPTITPVLDLSSLTRDANQMGSLLATSPLQAKVSYAAASDVSAQTQATAQAIFEASSTAPAVTQEVKFEQTNISPKALSPVEIYRNTRNQIAFAKEALKSS